MLIYLIEFIFGHVYLCLYRCNLFYISGVTLILLWVLLWALMGQEVLPGGNLFGLIVIFYSAFLGGKILEIIRIPVVPPLPPLLGKYIISCILCWLFVNLERFLLGLDILFYFIMWIWCLIIYIYCMCIYSFFI